MTNFRHRRRLVGGLMIGLLLAGWNTAAAGLAPQFSSPATNAAPDAVWTDAIHYSSADYTSLSVTVIRGDHIVPQINVSTTVFFNPDPPYDRRFEITLEPLTGMSGRVIVEVEATGPAGPASLVFDVVFLPVPTDPVVIDVDFAPAATNAFPGASFVGDIDFTPADGSVEFGVLILSGADILPPANVTFAPVASNRVTVTMEPVTNRSGLVTMEIFGEDTFTTSSVPVSVYFKTYPPVIIGPDPLEPVEIDEDTSITVDFTVTDPDSHPTNVTVTVSMTATTTNPRLFSDPGGGGELTVSGTGTNKTLLIRPADDMNGVATIQLRAEDETGNVVTHDFQLIVHPVPDVSEILGIPAVIDIDDNVGLTNLFASGTIIDVDHEMPDPEHLELFVTLNNDQNARFADGSIAAFHSGSPDEVTTALRDLQLEPLRFRGLPGMINTAYASLIVTSTNDHLSVTQDVAIAITVVNTPPTFDVIVDPPTVTEGGPMRQPFYLSFIYDPDFGDDTFTLDITLADPSQAALLTLGGATNVTDNFSGLSASIRNVTIQAPDSGTTNTAFEVDVRFALTDGYDGTAVETNTITILQKQTPPSISGIPLETVLKTDADPPFPAFPTVFVQDPDEAGEQLVRAVIAQSNPDLGDFGDTSAVEAYQTPTALTAALRALNYTLNPFHLPVGDVEDTVFTLNVFDRTGLSDRNSNRRIRVTSVNSPPQIAFLPPFDVQPVLIPPVDPVVPFTHTVVSNDDTNSVRFTIWLDDPAKGELTNLGGFDEIEAGVYRMQGSIAAIQGALTNIWYVLDPGFLFPPDAPGGTEFTLQARDYALLTTTRTLAIQVQEEPRNHLVTRAVNDGLPGSLDFALAAVGNNDVITFALPSYPATIRLPGTAATLIARNLSIKGPGADLLTLSGDANGDGIPDRQLFRIAANVTIEGVTLSHGTAGFGGAIAVHASGHLTLRDSAVVDSVAAQYGGGIDVDGGALTLDGCYIGRNRLSPDTGRSGAGVSVYSDKDITIVNTTFGANQQPNETGDGGGALVVQNRTDSTPMHARISHATFADNTDASGVASALLAVSFGTRIMPHNAIFADFSSRNLQVLGTAEFRSRGGNLCDDSTRTFLTQQGQSLAVDLLDHADDQVSIDPLLGPLAAGNPTPYYPLLPGSPAIDGSSASTAVRDQRGVLRADGVPDSGAIEYDALGRLVINEIRFDNDAGVNFIEIKVRRDSTPVDLAPYALYVDGQRVHNFADSTVIGTNAQYTAFDPVPTLLNPGFGMIVAFTNQPLMLTADVNPTAVVRPSLPGAPAGLNARGIVELGLGTPARPVARHAYLGTYLDPANGTNLLAMAGNSITLAPQVRGYALIPHGYAAIGPFAGADMTQVPTLNPSSPGAYSTGTPFGLDNALPLARPDTFTVGEDDLSVLDVLANDFDSDGNDRLVIVDVSTGSSPGAGDNDSALSALGATVTLVPTNDPLRGVHVRYDPRQAPQIQQIPAGVEIIDRFYYEIIDIGSAPVAAFADAGAAGTRVTSPNHRLSNGDGVIITGAALSHYNGTHSIDDVGDDTFTIPIAFVGNTAPRGMWESADPRSPSARSEAQVLVRVIGMNDPPVAVLDTITNVTERSTVRIMTRPERAGDATLIFPGDPVPGPVMLDQDLLSNDYDIDLDDTWETLRVIGVLSAVNPIAGFAGTPGEQPVSVQAPVHGLATGDEILIANYDGHPTYNGTHTVTVTGEDTFTIPVFFVDDAPVKGVWVVLDDSNRYTATSAAGASVKLTQRADPTFDNVVYDANASAFLRTLSEGQLHTDRFWYAIVDSHGAIGIGPVDVIVEGVNDPPVVNPDPDSLSLLAPIVDAGTNTLAQVLADGLDILYTRSPASGTTGLTDLQVLDLSGTLPGTLVLADFFVTDEDTPLDITTADLLANDSDIDQLDVLEVVAVEPLSREQATLTLAGGMITYDPTVSSNLQALARDELLLDTFEIVVSDGMTGGSITSLVAVLVIGVNDSPVAHPLDFRIDYTAEYTTDEDSAWSVLLQTLEVRGHAVELDVNQVQPDDRLRFVPTAAVPNPGGARVDISDTNIVHDATVSELLNQLADWQSFTNTFAYTITDNSFLFATDDRFHVPAGAQDRILDVLANDRDFTDAEGVLAIIDAGPSLHGAVLEIAADGGHLVYSAPDDFTGDDYFRYTIRNDKGDVTSARVLVRAVVPHLNGLLQASSNHYTLALGETAVMDVTANDSVIPAAGQNLVITGLIASNIAGQPVLTNNTFVYTATTTIPLQFTYEMSAGGEARAQAGVTVTVIDRRGVLRAQDDFFSVRPGSIDNPLDVLANDALLTAPKGHLRVLHADPAAHGTLTIDPSGTGLLYTPDPGFIGTEQISYVATDQIGGTGTATVHIASGRIDPVLNFFTLEATNNAPLALDVLANNRVLPTVPPTTLSIASVQPGAATIGTMTVDAAGTGLVFSASGTTGQQEFTYVVADASLPPRTATGRVIIESVGPGTYANPNVFAVRGNGENYVLDVLANDVSYPAGGQVYTILSLGTGADGPSAGGVVSLAGNQIVYTPAPGYYGEERFKYTLSDGVAMDVAEVVISVRRGDLMANANRYVVFYQLEEGGAQPRRFTLPVTLNDRIQPALGQTFQILATGLGVDAPDQGGSVSITPDKLALEYRPGAMPSPVFIERFTYELTDGAGRFATAEVHVEVRDRTAALTALTADDQFAVARNSSGNKLPVLANDFVLPGTAAGWTLTAVSPSVEGGATAIDGPHAVYTPPAGFVGRDTFTYHVHDGLGGTGSAAVHVYVGAQPLMPSLFTVLSDAEDEVLDVLANDVLVDGDADLYVLDAVFGPTHGGSVALGPDNTVLYTPDSGYAGPWPYTETFRYRVPDETGGGVTGSVQVVVHAAGSDRDSSTVTLLVEGRNDPPVIVNPPSDTPITDKQTASPFTEVTLVEVDEQLQERVDVTVSLDDADKGVLLNLGGFVHTGGGHYTLTDVTAAVATDRIRPLIFEPTENRITVPTTEPTRFTIAVTDNKSPAVTNTNTVVSVTAVNDPPVISGTLAGQEYYYRLPVLPFREVTVSEVDDLTLQPLVVTVTILESANGQLGELGDFVAQGGGVFRAAGLTAAEATAQLRALVFAVNTAAVPFGGSLKTRFQLSVDDGFAPPVEALDTSVVAMHSYETGLRPPTVAERGAFGLAVDAFDSFALVGAPNASVAGANSGAAFIYERAPDGTPKWTEWRKLLPATVEAGHRFGRAVALREDRAAVGAVNAAGTGAVYLFDRDLGGVDNWGESTRIAPTNLVTGGLFGQSVALSPDGMLLVVGAPDEDINGDGTVTGGVFLFGRDTGGPAAWGEIMRWAPDGAGSGGADAGWSVALTADALVVGAPRFNVDGSAAREGKVFVLLSSSPWTLVQTLAAADVAASREFGWSVGLDGDLLAVGAPAMAAGTVAGAGRVFVYEREDGTNTFALVRQLDRRNDTERRFGHDLVVNGSRLLIGAPHNDTAQNIGATYLYDRPDNGNANWTLIEKLTRPAGHPAGLFGTAVGYQKGSAVIGAPANLDEVSNRGYAFLYRFDHGIEPGLTYSLSIDPVFRSHGSGGSTGQSLSVLANVGWTATNDVPWIAITGGLAGGGDGTVTYSVDANTATTGRSGTLTVSGGGITRTFTVNQAGTASLLSISPTSRDHAAAGVTGQTIAVTSNEDWTATNSVAWITLTAGTAGSGDGTVTYDAGENLATTPRSGTITVLGGGLMRTFTVNQAAAALALTIDPASRVHGAAGAAGQTVDVGGNVAWTATANQAWIAITEGAAGSGSGTVTYSVAGNPATSPRSGTITVAGEGLTRTFTVDQDGAAPALELTPSSRNHGAAPAGGQTIGVTGNVAWTATKTAAWITITGGASGSGAGTVTYSISGNTGAARSTTITVAGGGLTRTFTVNQAASTPTLAIDPASRDHVAGGATGQTIGVTGNVAWTATASQAWIGITDGASGSSAGTVIYDVAANASAAPRSGTITVAGGGLTRIFTVNQAGAPPVLEIDPDGREHGAEPASGQTIAVTGNVAWTATGSIAWFAITAGASGSGDGTVLYSVERNTAPTSRTGTVTVANGALTRVFTVAQSGATMQPSGGVDVDTRRPEFAWPAIAGATWYQLWITRNGATHASPWIQGTTTWTPGSDLPAGTYTWWVRGWSAATGNLPWSSSATFTVPSLQPGAITQIAPEGAQTSRDLVFVWDQTDRRATWFKLWVSHPGGGTWHDQWYATTADAESAVAVNTHPGGASTWWLRGWGPDGYGPWSGPMAFSTPSPLPSTPTLLEPSQGATVTGAVEFAYEAFQAEWYRVYVSRNGTVVLDQWTAAETFDAGVLSAGNYRWWIGAWNTETATTVWSDRGEFSVP